MSHTPGPWTYDEENCLIRGSNPHEDVFDLSGACYGEDTPADIRLVCAAPDLLEALQFYANPENWAKYRSGTRHRLGGELPGIAEAERGEIAREAIRKALGQ